MTQNVLNRVHSISANHTILGSIYIISLGTLYRREVGPSEWFTDEIIYGKIEGLLLGASLELVNGLGIIFIVSYTVRFEY